MRVAFRVVLLLVASALVVGCGFLWKDHLTGVWGPGSRAVPTLGGADPPGADDRGGEGRRRPPIGGDRDFGSPSGAGGDDRLGRVFDRLRGERRDGAGRSGQWFSIEGLKGFLPMLLPLLVLGAGVIGLDQLSRARRRSRRIA